jgi:hypothetical protein
MGLCGCSCRSVATTARPVTLTLRAWNVGRVSLHDPRIQRVLAQWTRGVPTPRAKPPVDVFVLCEVALADAKALVRAPPAGFACFMPAKHSYGATMCVAVQTRLAAQVSWQNHRLVAVAVGRLRVINVHGYRAGGCGTNTRDARAARTRWFNELYALLADGGGARTVVLGDYNYDFAATTKTCALAERMPLPRVALPSHTYENHKNNVAPWRGGAFGVNQHTARSAPYRLPPPTLTLDHIFASTDVTVDDVVVGSDACAFDLDHRWIGARVCV